MSPDETRRYMLNCQYNVRYYTRLLGGYGTLSVSIAILAGILSSAAVTAILVQQPALAALASVVTAAVVAVQSAVGATERSRQLVAVLKSYNAAATAFRRAHDQYAKRNVDVPREEADRLLEMWKAAEDDAGPYPQSWEGPRLRAQREVLEMHGLDTTGFPPRRWWWDLIP